jgi:hypothetical protein
MQLFLPTGLEAAWLLGLAPENKCKQMFDP